MIARNHRFHGRSSLKPVYERGRTVRGTGIAVRFLLNERRPRYRAAVVVSKKVHKSAVARNRIRRRIFEILRTSLPDNTPAYDLVVTIFSEKVSELSPEQLHKELTDLLNQANLIKRSKQAA